jgi:hypothetical protein
VERERNNEKMKDRDKRQFNLFNLFNLFHASGTRLALILLTTLKLTERKTIREQPYDIDELWLRYYDKFVSFQDWLD